MCVRKCSKCDGSHSCNHAFLCPDCVLQYQKESLIPLVKMLRTRYDLKLKDAKHLGELINLLALGYEKRVLEVERTGTKPPTVRCNDSECMASSGVHGGLTFGKGYLDWNGYWEFPCSICKE